MPSNGRRGGASSSDLRASLERHFDAMQEAEVAVPAPAPAPEESLPPIQVPPEDPMVPHEADTAGVIAIRSSIIGSGGWDAVPQQTRDVMITLCGHQRSTWLHEQQQRRNQPQTASRQASPYSDWMSSAGDLWSSMPPPTFGGHSHSFTSSGRRAGRARENAPVARESAEPAQTFSGNTPETSTMNTVASVFGMRVSYPTIEKHPFIVGTNLAGVEIELENLNIEHPRFNYWTAKSDGSLRNAGMEFVCSHPWGGIDLYNAALEIDSFLFNNNPDSSWRCSTHVHVDVRDMTAKQLKKMILAYIFYERVLFKCSGWQRYKNNFCVALGFAQGQLDDLANWWDLPDSSFMNRLSSSWDKYTAINFLPMSSFGSVEFRISEAKWHKGQLIRLVNRFLSLKEVAMAQADMTDEEFIEFLMGCKPEDVIHKGIPRGMGDIQEDLEVGYKLAYDVISMSKIRRRSRVLFTPRREDGSRLMRNVRVFSNGWAHCKSHLEIRYPDLEFPEEPGNEVSFSWLYELRKMMRRHRLTFESVWFMPEQNREQLRRLFREYITEREQAEAESAVPDFLQAEPIQPSWEETQDEEPEYDDEDVEDDF